MARKRKEQASQGEQQASTSSAAHTSSASTASESSPQEPQAAAQAQTATLASAAAILQASQQAAAIAQASAAASIARADSHAAAHQEPQAITGNQPGDADAAGKTEAGNVPSPATSAATAEDAALARTRVVSRLTSEKRWNRETSELRDVMYMEAKRGGMTKEQAQVWTYAELDRLYPPPKAQSVALLKTESPQGDDSTRVTENNSRTTSEGAGIKGLSDLPTDWPELPPNASISADVAWVQAERLRVVEERPSGGTVVVLAKAARPAPSWSALSWLETSIRSYAKFVEVAAKVASGASGDEGEQVKRERMQIEEIRGLLREMAGNSPGPGR